MNAGVTGAMDRIAASPILSAAAPSVVIVALIVCFVVREVLRAAGGRYRTLAQDLVVAIVPLFIAGTVILLIQIIALTQP